MPELLNSIPRFASRLIHFWCADDLHEEIEGNLIEYLNTMEDSAKLNSKFKFWVHTLSYLRWSTLRKSFALNRYLMFHFNPKITLRAVWNQRSTTFINLFGFTVGLVCVFYLYFHIRAEMATDSFHKDKDKTYRVLRVSNIVNEPYNIGVTSGPYAEALKIDYPGIETTCRTQPETGLVSFGEKSFYEENLLFADANFFQFFSYPLALGHAESVLQEQNSVVLSQQIARKYFGDQNPVGQSIIVDNELEFIVTGVFDELPARTHLIFDMVFSIQFMEQYDFFGNWWNNGLFTYLKLNPNQDVAELETLFPEFMDKYFGEDFAVSGNRLDLILEPLDQIYFNRDTRFDWARHGNLSTLMILAVVAASILFIACFNYLNMSIAVSFKRAREIGIRKIVGSNRIRLSIQFLSEVFIVCLTAILVSVLLTELVTPIFNTLFSLDVQTEWTDVNVIYFILAILLLTTVLSGLYPSIQMSLFNPMNIIRGQLNLSKNIILRKSLVVTQFTVSIFMIVATTLITSQYYFISSKDKGFDNEAVVLIDLNNSTIRQNRETLKSELLNKSRVLNVSMMSGEPGGFHDAATVHIEGIEESMRLRTLFTDEEYLNLFNIDQVYGNPFNPEASDSTRGVMLNAKALKDLGMEAEELMGRRLVLDLWDVERTIVGVAGDFNFQSLHTGIEPLIIVQGGGPRKLAVKLSPGSYSEGIRQIEEAWEAVSPDFPISHTFMDDKLARLYADEKKQTLVFGSFSIVSIFLACMGVAGLAFYSAMVRKKEFGVRKVLGATVSQVIGLISREFIILIVIATVIATPLILYFISNWLEGFAYRINLWNYWSLFLIGGIGTAAIAWITVTLISYQIANTNPTESLRSE